MPSAPTTTSSSTSHGPTVASPDDELERIPFLPETPFGQDAALQRRHRSARRARPHEDAIAPGRYLGLYLKYVALFVGAGLISGSIVHYPLDKTRYLIIGAVGAVFFALASTFGDARAKGHGAATLVRFVVASLVLALGIGMISGGIQHFSDIPTRAATLIPMGGLLSILAFAVRDGHRLSARRIAPFAVAVGAVLLWLAIGLGMYSKTFDVPAAGHHGTVEADTTGAAADEHAAEGTEGMAASEGEDHVAEEGIEDAAASETADGADVGTAAEDHSAHGH